MKERSKRLCSPVLPKGFAISQPPPSAKLTAAGRALNICLCATGQAVVTLTLGLFFVLVWLVGFLGGFVGFCFFFFNSFLFG